MPMRVSLEKVCALNEYRWIGEGKGGLSKDQKQGRDCYDEPQDLFFTIKSFKSIKMRLNLSPF